MLSQVKCQIYTSKFHIVQYKQVHAKAILIDRHVAVLKNRMILDIHLSAITNSSCGFIAAAEAVSCCISHPLINAVYTLERGLDATEWRTVHRWSEIKDEGAFSI